MPDVEQILLNVFQSLDPHIKKAEIVRLSGCRTGARIRWRTTRRWRAA
jgi:hypothetical protein